MGAPPYTIPKHVVIEKIVRLRETLDDLSGKWQ
jgi:hypothetical protein